MTPPILVRPVSVNGAPSIALKTRNPNVTLQAGQPIEIFWQGRWRTATIEGTAYSELQVRV